MFSEPRFILLYCIIIKFFPFFLISSKLSIYNFHDFFLKITCIFAKNFVPLSIFFIYKSWFFLIIFLGIYIILSLIVDRTIKRNALFKDDMEFSVFCSYIIWHSPRDKVEWGDSEFIYLVLNTWPIYISTSASGFSMRKKETETAWIRCHWMKLSWKALLCV